MVSEFHLHLVSDSTGNTVSTVARSSLAQFDDVEPEEHMHTLIRTKSQLERAIAKIEADPGFVLYTLADGDLRKQLRKACKSLKIPCISVVEIVIHEFSNFLGKQATDRFGRQYVLDKDYFNRMEAVDYTLTHDDGQLYWEMDEAEIILIGPSRTSKSPTSIYLAYKGYKTANVPFVSGTGLPDILFELSNPFIVGLVVTPHRLEQIRKQRMLSISEKSQTDYIDIEKISQEMLEARRIYTQNNWPVIDVTRRSIEEVAAQVLKLYKKREG